VHTVFTLLLLTIYIFNMKKNKAFSTTSWIYFVLAYVLILPLFAVSIAYNQLTASVILIATVIFTICMACAIHYRTSVHV
jgi:hypothetical protein